jgi:hypothetical protein
MVVCFEMARGRGQVKAWQLQAAAGLRRYRNR